MECIIFINETGTKPIELFSFVFYTERYKQFNLTNSEHKIHEYYLSLVIYNWVKHSRQLTSHIPVPVPVGSPPCIYDKKKVNKYCST